MQAAMVPRRGVHSVETHGQRTRPDTSFPKHRAATCRDCLWDRLHEPHAPFLLGWRTHVVGVMSSFFSCFFIVAQTYSLSSHPSRSKQEKPQKFPNSVKSVTEPYLRHFDANHRQVWLMTFFPPISPARVQAPRKTSNVFRCHRFFPFHPAQDRDCELAFSYR